MSMSNWAKDSSLRLWWSNITLLLDPLLWWWRALIPENEIEMKRDIDGKNGRKWLASKWSIGQSLDHGIIMRINFTYDQLHWFLHVRVGQIDREQEAIGVLLFVDWWCFSLCSRFMIVHIQRQWIQVQWFLVAGPTGDRRQVINWLESFHLTIGIHSFMIQSLSLSSLHSEIPGF